MSQQGVLSSNHFKSCNLVYGLVKYSMMCLIGFFERVLLQACMSIPKEKLLEEISDLKDDGERSPLVHICKNIISAFTKLRETDE